MKKKLITIVMGMVFWAGLFGGCGQTEVKQEEPPKQMFTNKDDSAVKQPKKRADEKIGRNDPCPCGSGKKYKQCCGRNV